MNFGLQLRLAPLNVEMDALVDGFDIIKTSIKTLEDEELREFNRVTSNNNLTEDEQIDLYIERQYTINSLYPKVFWSAYLISVYSFFETAALELGEKISATIGCDEKLFYGDNRRDLLINIKKHYGKKLNVIDFSSCIYWETITQLNTVRNCYAHANGRIDYCNDNSKKKLYKIITKRIGVSEEMGILLVDERFVKSCLDSVLEFVGECIDIYSKYEQNSRLRFHSVGRQTPQTRSVLHDWSIKIWKILLVCKNRFVRGW